MSAPEPETKPAPIPSECARCRVLEEQVFRLTMERQLLVERLADERERANAVIVGLPLPSAAPSPAAAPVEPKPLRYQLVDRINEAVYRMPGYEMARRLAQSLTS